MRIGSRLEATGMESTDIESKEKERLSIRLAHDNRWNSSATS